MIYIFKIVIPAWIHVRLSCLMPFGLMQICFRQICAGAEDREANPGSMDGFELTIPYDYAQDRPRHWIPASAGMTSLRINLAK
jgi:hypothetical protein